MLNALSELNLNKETLSFFGALIGALAPFLLYAINQVIKNYRLKVDNLRYITRVLYIALNGTDEFKFQFNNFFDVQLSGFKDYISELNLKGEAFFAGAYMPNINFFILPEDIIKKDVTSNFLADKLLESYNLSKTIQSSFNDCHKQFHGTIDDFKQMNLSKLNTPISNNTDLINNLNSFEKAHKTQLNLYIDKYLSQLFYALEATRLIYKFRVIPWRVIYLCLKIRYIFGDEFSLEKLFSKNVEEWMNKTNKI